MYEPDRCPRCGGTKFSDREANTPDTGELLWIEYVCAGCGLYTHGFDQTWKVPSDYDGDEDKDYVPPEEPATETTADGPDSLSPSATTASAFAAPPPKVT